MKRILAITLPIITIVGLLIAYIRRFINNLSFKVDLEIKLIAITEEFIVMPLLISISSKNKKNITVKDLNVKLYDLNNNLLAETYSKVNRYTIEGFKNNNFTHDFMIYTKTGVVDIIEDKIKGKETNVYIVTSFIIFSFIPISKREEFKI